MVLNKDLLFSGSNFTLIVLIKVYKKVVFNLLLRTIELLQCLNV